MVTETSEKQEVVPVRYNLPSKTHDKLKKYRRKMSLHLDRDITMQDAIIDLINKAKLTQ